MAGDFTTFEHAYYIGNYMSGILYGIAIILYFWTMKALFTKNIHNDNSSRSKKFFAIYSTILFVLLTIDIAVNAYWGQVMWIDGRYHEGGVYGWFVKNVSVWYQTMGSTTVVIMIFMGDALLLYRLYIIYGSKWYVVAIPLLAYLAAFSLAIIQLVIAGKPGGNFFKGKNIDFGIPYYTLTICFNIVVTGLICARLWKLGSALSKALGRDASRMYTSVAAMLIESAAPYAAVGIMFLIPYAIGSGTAIGFGQVWAKLSCLSPQLIVLRVVTGRAWRRETVSNAQNGVIYRPKSERPEGVEFDTSTHVYTDGGTTMNHESTAFSSSGNADLEKRGSGEPLNPSPEKIV